MGQTRSFIQRQALLIGAALVAYLGVRMFTQGDFATARRNARQILNIERSLGIDIERGLQTLLTDDHGLITLANWIYVWGYWPVLAATLVYLGAKHRGEYTQLRNAMFISGAIGLIIFATYAVAPPRLFAPSLYVDTIQQNSLFSGIIQPPSLANKYAAVPSFHFGWILLVAMALYRTVWSPVARLAFLAMPVGMAFAVVVTANHWILDIVAGGVVALVGWGIEHYRPRLLAERWARQAVPQRAVINVDRIDEKHRRQHQPQG